MLRGEANFLILPDRPPVYYRHRSFSREMEKTGGLVNDVAVCHFTRVFGLSLDNALLPLVMPRRPIRGWTSLAKMSFVVLLAKMSMSSFRTSKHRCKKFHLTWNSWRGRLVCFFRFRSELQ